MTEYRIRFEPRSALSGDALTAKPGTIRRNRPKALRVLARLRQVWPNDVWLESRESPDDNWKREEE